MFFYRNLLALKLYIPTNLLTMDFQLVLYKKGVRLTYTPQDKSIKWRFNLYHLQRYNTMKEDGGLIYTTSKDIQKGVKWDLP